jgi:hypothetical protein
MHEATACIGPWSMLRIEALTSAEKKLPGSAFVVVKRMLTVVSRKKRSMGIVYSKHLLLVVHL